jgi:MscS family membrane protein
MEYLDIIFDVIGNSFGISNLYLQSLIVLVLFIVVARILLFVFSQYLQVMAKKTKTNFDDILFDKTKMPIFYLINSYGFKLALANVYQGIVANNVVNSIIVVFFVLLLSRLLDVIIITWGESFAKKTKTKIDEVLLPLFQKASKVVFVIVATMWILDIFKIDIGPYLAGVGISGIVLGLALQDSLKNVLGGVSLILDGAFHVGDKIKIESGDIGKILDIGLRSTKVITFDNEVIYIPNGYLANSRVQNFTRPNLKIRVVVDFTVAYGSPVDKVKKVILGAVMGMGDIMKDPEPVVEFVSMGDFSLNFKTKFWVEDLKDSYDRKLEANRLIYDTLNKNKIEIPYPTSVVLKG